MNSIRRYSKALMGVIAGLSFLSCQKDNVDDYITYNPALTCQSLNDNVLFVRQYVKSYVDQVVVSGVEVVRDDSKNEAIAACFFNDVVLQFDNLISFDNVIPQVGLVRDGDEFFWSIEGVGDMERVSVTDEQRIPRFQNDKGSWSFSFDDSVWFQLPSASLGKKKMEIQVSANMDFLVGDMGNGLQLIVPTNKVYGSLPSDSKNKVFYKDVFLDAGVGLTNRRRLAAAEYLGYTLDYVAVDSDSAWQNAILGGSEDDENGRLLYPDGQPRYRMLFVCGGNSRKHGPSLRGRCRENMRTFVKNGGSYVGTCAGGFFASNGYDDQTNVSYYLGLWPGVVGSTNLSKTYTSFSIGTGSPLLQYREMQGTSKVDSIYHNLGGYPIQIPTGTEILSYYDYPNRPAMHEKPSGWAYKESAFSGRVVMEGSHPEWGQDGPVRDLMAAMMRYAADGVGVVRIKQLLRNGEEVTMDKSSRDDDPAHAMIGDLQCHHFAVYIPRNATNIVFTISTPVSCDLCLFLSDKGYAFPDESQYSITGTNTKKRMKHETLSEGLWFVSVQNRTTVTSTDTDNGQEYSGRTDLLNGVPYSIKVSWQVAQR